MPNKIGVLLNHAPAELRNNIIAHNTEHGVFILGEKAVRIEGGPIYANGDGLGAAGIHYASKPPVLLGRLAVLRTAEDAQGKVTVIFFFATAHPDAAGEVEVEIFGNSAGGTQGRVPLARRTVPLNTLQRLRFDVEARSAFATQDAFTLLLTRSGRTSEFAEAVAAKTIPAFPEIKSIDLKGEEIQLEWPASEFFVVEQAATLSGPWKEVTVPPKVEDGVATLVLPVESHTMFFRLNLKL